MYSMVTTAHNTVAYSRMSQRAYTSMFSTHIRKATMLWDGSVSWWHGDNSVTHECVCWGFIGNFLQSFALRKHTYSYAHVDTMHTYTRAHSHTRIHSHTHTHMHRHTTKLYKPSLRIKKRSNIVSGQEEIDTKTRQGNYRMEEAHKVLSHKLRCKSLNKTFTNKSQQCIKRTLHHEHPGGRGGEDRVA